MASVGPEVSVCSALSTTERLFLPHTPSMLRECRPFRHGRGPVLECDGSVSPCVFLPVICWLPVPSVLLCAGPEGNWMCRKMLRPGTWMIHPGSVAGFAPEFVHAWSRLALMPSSCAALAGQNQPGPDVYLLVSELNVLFFPGSVRCEPAHRWLVVS